MVCEIQIEQRYNTIQSRGQDKTIKMIYIEEKFSFELHCR